LSIPIKWSKRAKLDIKSIYAYIHEKSPKGADKTHNRIIGAGSLLSDNPDIGTAGTLELVVKISQRTTYTAIYRRNSDMITVLRVIHGARDIPDYTGEIGRSSWLI